MPRHKHIELGAAFLSKIQVLETIKIYIVIYMYIN